MIQIPSQIDHLPIVLELVRDNKNLSVYHKHMARYRTSLESAMNSYNEAMETLASLAAENE